MLDEVALHGAEVLRWPAQATLRSHLARAGIPRLLLIDPDSPPPASVGVDEDWLRSPALAVDVEARAVELVRRVRQRRADGVWVEPNHVLHRGRATVVLSGAEALVATMLLDAHGEVVPHDTIVACLWPDRQTPGRRALDAVVYRLRRRTSGLGILVETVRSQGLRLRLA